MSDKPQTTHLLPAVNPRYPTSDNLCGIHTYRKDNSWYSSPAPVPSTSGPPTIPSPPSNNNIGYMGNAGYMGYNYHISKHTTASWKRYIGIFVKDGKRSFGKVITQLTINEWAKQHGFIIEKSQPLYGNVDPEKEKTEFSI